MKQQDLLDAGFSETQDLMFRYEKVLVSDDTIEIHELEDYELPKLLYGSNGVGNGFCVYTGFSFIWLNVSTIAEALNFANKINSIEPLN